jgi:tetratricopeptide (TPR) repeat protein
MKNPFGDKRDPELQAREAIRHKKWSKAIAYYEQKLRDNERDFSLWNLLGDLHMNNRSRAQAVEAWRHAVEGFALEGLHENVLGIARKILRRTPEEEDVHLVMADAYLGLEYHADCLAALRTYLKLAKHRSESDLRSIFKKILDANFRHVHLIEELRAIYKDSGVEDIELERRLEDFIAAKLNAVSETRARAVSAAASEAAAAPAEETIPPEEPSNQDGLLTLSGIDSFSGDVDSELSYGRPSSLQETPADANGCLDVPAAQDSSEIPAGEGKDHYDLGMVYKEMKLWDAAIVELEQARRDQSLRMRATLALAECLQESHDLQRALELLEAERQSSEGSPQEHLSVQHQLGVVHELLGNLDEALHHYETVGEINPNYGDVEARISALRSRLGNESSES